MKKLFTLFLLAMLNHFSFAQEALDPGNRVIGGGLSVNLRMDGNESSSSFSQSHNSNASCELAPSYSVVIKKNTLIGASLLFRPGYRLYWSERGLIRTTQDLSTSMDLGVGFFYKKYIPISEKIGAFIQPGVYYQADNSKSKRREYDTLGRKVDVHIFKGNGHEGYVNVDIGLYYFITSKLSLETNLGSFQGGLEFQKSARKSQSDPNESKGKSAELFLNGSFLNELSFSRMFTVNYFF